MQMQQTCPVKYPVNRRFGKSGGIVLAEAVVGIGVFAMIVGTVLTGYVTTTRRLAWASNAAAAQAMAVGSLEQAFGAKWKWNSSIDEMTNACASPLINMFVRTQTNTFMVNGLATNAIIILTVQTNDPKLRMVTVNCAWSFQGKNYTNTVAALRGQNY